MDRKTANGERHIHRPHARRVYVLCLITVVRKATPGAINRPGANAGLHRQSVLAEHLHRDSDAREREGHGSAVGVERLKYRRKWRAGIANFDRAIIVYYGHFTSTIAAPEWTCV